MCQPEAAKNPQAARDWFERAAEGGYPQAPGNLGRQWNSGALGDENHDRNAVSWYDRGHARGDGWSGANAACIIANRNVPGFTATDAAIRAAKAAALGNPEAAAEARAILAALSGRAVDGAAQSLVNKLGGALTVDGAFGAPWRWQGPTGGTGGCGWICTEADTRSNSKNNGRITSRHVLVKAKDGKQPIPWPAPNSNVDSRVI